MPKSDETRDLRDLLLSELKAGNMVRFYADAEAAKLTDAQVSKLIDENLRENIVVRFFNVLSST
jgi:hypothetical protein